MLRRLLPLVLLGCGSTDPIPTGTGSVPTEPSIEVPTVDLGAMEPYSLVADPPGGTFVDSVEVALEVPGFEAPIWFTVDGSVPAVGQGIPYDGPFTLTASTQVRAVAELGPGLIVSVAPTFLALEPSLDQASSDLPVLVLWSRGAAPTSKQETYEDFTLTVFEPPEGFPLAWPAPADASVRAGLKIRGSSSSGYPKHPYRVETWGALDDLDADVALLGMPADADWVLLAPLNFDRALMRNALMYRLSNEIGRYAPRTRFVEVFVAEQGEPLGVDDYQGIYVVVERVERNPDRVDIERLLPTDLTEPALTGGYLFKEDRPGPGETGFWAGSPGGAFYFQQPFVLTEPSELEAAPEQAAYVVALLDELGDALNAPDFRSPTTGRHYEDLIDVDAWIDHHILNVFSKNPDAFRLSGYFHKDRGGLVAAGPIWDFDRTMGCDQDSRAADPTWWDNSNETSDTTYVFEHGFWLGLFRDPLFRDRYWARWDQLLANELSLASVNLAIAEMEAELESSAPRNYATWSSYPPRGGSLGSEVDLLEGWIAARHAWIQGCLTSPDPQACTGP